MVKVHYNLYRNIPQFNFGGLIYSNNIVFYRTQESMGYESFINWVRSGHEITFLFTFKYYVLV